MFTSYTVHRVIEENEPSKPSKEEQCHLCFSCAVKAVINKGEVVNSMILEDRYGSVICDDC